MNNLQWHPMMVHFPLALTLTGFLCLLFSRLLQHRPLHASLAVCGTWNFIIAGITALMTLGTGLIAAWHLQLHGGAQYSVSRHVIWAVCTSQLVVLLGLWRAFANSIEKTPSPLFLMLGLIACAGFIVTGYYGGENVYHYAIGVRGPSP
ncbi:MAG TPA: DUF2231 domain-containing protein [Xanthobacteraceae bacterium]|jgi:uncharacterized membrane protein